MKYLTKKFSKDNHLKFSFKKLRSGFRSYRKFSANCDKKKYLVYVSTENQKRSILPVLQHLDRREIQTISYYRDHDKNTPPADLKVFLGLKYLPLIIGELLFSRSRYVRNSMLMLFWDYLAVYGYYNYLKKFILSVSPNLVLISNDHSPDSRALLFAAKRMSVATAYVPHGSVSYLFPPLEFDYAFLEGEDMHEKYIRIGLGDTKVILSGIAKLDAFIRAKKVLSGRIAICVNMNDQEVEVFQLVDKLIGEAGIDPRSMIFRPHPRDRRWNKEWITDRGLDFSGPDTESSMQLLSKVDVVISGGSNILLEAALLKVAPIQCDLGNTDESIRDYYGFLKNGLLGRIYKLEEVVQLMKDFHYDSFESSFKAAKYYCSTVGTEFEGRSGELIVEEIKKIELDHES